jgi:YaiO family outer membrane protein
MRLPLIQLSAFAYLLGFASLDNLMAQSPAVFYSDPYVELAASYEKLNNNYADWKQQSLNLFFPLREHGSLAVSLQNADRYTARDQSMSLTYSRAISIGVIEFATTQSNKPIFLAQEVYALGLSVPLAASNNVLLSYRDSEYANNRSQNKGIGFESYVGAYRLAYTATYSTLDHKQSGWSHTITTQWLNDNARIGITYANGREPTEIGANNLVNAKTETVELKGMLPIDSRLSLTGALWHTQQDRFYSRTGAEIGLRVSY